MARVNLDSEMFGDTRFVFLAQLLGMADPDTARMKCARVWHECTLRGRPVLPAATIDIASGIPGFAEKLVEAELGRVQRGQVYVCGARGRIEWFQDKKRAGKAGGEATRRAWKEKNASDSHTLTEGHVPSAAARAVARPSASASASASSSSSEEKTTAAPSFALTPPRPEGPKPGTLLKAIWLPWYEGRYGAKFEWFAKEGAQAARLMKLAGERGAPEVLRRAEIAAAQDWRKTPVTLGALCEGWNGLSVEEVNTKLSPAEPAELDRARRVVEGT